MPSYSTSKLQAITKKPDDRDLHWHPPHINAPRNPPNHAKNQIRSLMKENEREPQIQRALKALESGKYTSLGEAAIAFNVPKSTLCHRRMCRQTQHEKEQLLSAAAEDAIVRCILKLDD